MNKIYILLLSFCCLLMGSCRDDLLYDNEFGEGEANLTFSIDFSPIVHTIDTRSTRSDGSALTHINSLCVLVYTADGKHLLKRIPQSDLINYKVENNNKEMASDALNESQFNPSQAETDTPTATFMLQDIPFGRYQFYAVANMGQNLDGFSDDDIETVEQLQSISLTWDESDVTKNDQMFGFFCLADEAYSNGFDGPAIPINKNNVALKAWLKRAASKVTVAVDGSGLYENVQVWIKSIQVKDIADMCWLGKDNTAPPHLIENGEKYVVSETDGADAADAANIVTKTHTFPAVMNDAHASDAAGSLFFYENMQGNGQLKTQVWPAQEDKNKPMFPDGNNPSSQGYKDNKISGTYVEVIGYYKNLVGEGPIIYRFMLGKNITDNYDAQRNHHFKLTLKLKNNANENDWHIVYNQEPDIFIRSPFYVSYLYGQGENYPFKVVGGSDMELTRIVIKIPDNEITKNSWAPKGGEVTEEDKKAQLAIDPPGSTTGGDVYYLGTVDNPGPWNGFLSLTKEPVDNGYGIWPGTGADKETYNPDAPITYTYNKTYFETNQQGKREYYFPTPGEQDYEIIKTAPGEYQCNIPLYTKARVMVSQTGYTGNNPYAAYNRESQIEVFAEFQKSNGELIRTETKVVPVIQGRRVMNPKAVWRGAKNVDPFHVQLKILESQSSAKFSNLISDGPWRAEVIVGKDWIQLTPTAGASQQNPDFSITGTGDPYDVTNPGCVIDFYLKPVGATNKPRGGIIRILYNNYSCVHTIFVRQGFDPITMYDTNTYWHTYNLRTGGSDGELAEEAYAPEVEGSYFRRFNRQYPIEARSNTKEYVFKNGMTRDYKVAKPNGATVDMKWEQIWSSATSWGTFNVKTPEGKTYYNCELPLASDWISLANNPNTTYGFGVLYADGAVETSEDISKVFGATPGDYQSGCGMRGVIICNQSNGDQIFLPIAATGYGRFKQKTTVDRYNRIPLNWGGVIQYANRYTWYPYDPNSYNSVTYKPLFYDLWEGEGTMYWCGDDGDGYALDINYNTLDFVVNDLPNLGLTWADWAGGTDPSGTDAIHLRLVHRANATSAPRKPAPRKAAPKKSKTRQ